MRYRRAFQPGASYFFTLVTHERSQIFRGAATVEVYRRAVRKVQAARSFVLDAEVILPDHIHLICTLPEGDSDFPTRVRLIKSAFTRSLADRLRRNKQTHSRSAKREQPVWQRRYWEHIIRDERDFQSHLDYIHINPVKHGFVTAAREWPYSTFLQWVERGVYDLWWGSDEVPALPEWVGRE